MSKPRYSALLVLLVACGGPAEDPGVMAPDSDSGPDPVADGGPLESADAAIPEKPDLYPDGTFEASVVQAGLPVFEVKDAVFRHLDDPSGEGKSVLVLTNVANACATYDKGFAAWDKVTRVEIVFYRSGAADPTSGSAWWKTQEDLGPTFPVVSDVLLVRNRQVAGPTFGDVITNSFDDGRLSGTAVLRFEGDPDNLYTELTFNTERVCPVLE